MSFTDVVKTVLEEASTPLTPQEIRDIIKVNYPSYYGTDSHKRNVEKGHYKDIDYALLAQIYSVSQNSESFSCDNSSKPKKVSLTSQPEFEVPLVEDFESEEGTVYILKTDTFTKEGKEIIKIGFTTQSVEKRLNQLYTTGVPFKFRVHKTQTTTRFIELEQALHKLLDKFKLNKSREFFTEDALPYVEKIINLHLDIQASEPNASTSSQRPIGLHATRLSDEAVAESMRPLSDEDLGFWQNNEFPE